jgi:hypothetical protein
VIAPGGATTPAIEEQLKKRYVKDLLGPLQAIGVELVDEKRGDRPVQRLPGLRVGLEVAVVHHAPAVDVQVAAERQLDERYNLFGLKAGQLAVIDDACFQTALRLCGGCADRLVAGPVVSKSTALPVRARRKQGPRRNGAPLG